MRQLAFDFLSADGADVAHMQFLAQGLGKLVDGVALLVEQCLAVVHLHFGVVDGRIHGCCLFLFLFDVGKCIFERRGFTFSAFLFLFIGLDSLVGRGDVSLQVLGFVAFFAQFGQMQFGKCRFLGL